MSKPLPGTDGENMMAEEADIGLMSLSNDDRPPPNTSSSSPPPKTRPKPPPMNLRRASTLSGADRTSPLSPIRLKRRSRQPSVRSPAEETEQPTTFEMEVEKVARLRRWMLGLVVGE
jgi:hypothetical protein